MSLKKCFSVIGDLSSVNRYSQSYLTKPENVLEHTGFVSMLAYFIGIRTNEVNLDKLLSRAIVHDIDEIITGDLPHPVKYHNETLHKEINKLECENMKQICLDLDDCVSYERWFNAKDNSVEGFIIKVCDAAAVLYKIEQEYYTLGNKTILGHCKTMYYRLVSFKEDKHYENNSYLNAFINDLDLLQQKMYKDWENEN